MRLQRERRPKVLYNWRKVDWALMPLGFGVVPHFLSISLTPLVSSSTSLFLLTSPGQWRRTGRKLNTQRQLSPPLFSTPSGYLEFKDQDRPRSGLTPPQREASRSRENRAEMIASEKAALFALERHPGRRTLPVQVDRARTRGSFNFTLF